ncbi:MAG TPA: HD domain-containing phosphohydrolase [Capsulimonadaceae bacterium]
MVNPTPVTAVKPAALVGCDSTGRIVAINAEAEILLACDADAALGRHVTELLPDFPLAACFSGSEIDCSEIRSTPALVDGESILVDCVAILMPMSTVERLMISIRPAQHPSLRLVDGGHSSIGHDVDLTTVLPVFRESAKPVDERTVIAGSASPFVSGHLLLSSIVNTVDDAVWALDTASNELLFVNPAGARIFGATLDQLLGSPGRWLASVHPDDRGRVDECLQFLLSYGSMEFECRTIAADSVERWIYTKARAIRDDNGTVIRAEGVTTDITERKQRELHLGRLNGQLRRRVERVSALHQIDSAISTSQDLALTLGICLDHLTGQLQVDAARILIYDPYTQRLKYAAGTGFRHGGRRDIQRLIGTLQAGKAALGRCTIFIPDISARSEAFSSSTVLEDQEFVSYYAIPLIIKGQIKGILEIFQRKTLNPDKDWTSFVEALAVQAAIAIDNDSVFDRLQQSNSELSVAYDETIEGWSRALDLRDKETEGHSRRVTDMSLRLSKALGASDLELMYVRRGALLHDIGKMGIPDQILLKPGALTDEEWVIMKRHPVYAYEMLSPIDFLKPSLDIPYAHHEKWDGTGYPRGLKGVQIPLSARVFAVVDVWDALCSDRPYRAGWPVEKIIAHIRQLSGTHFDPQVVDVFLAQLSEGEYDDLIRERAIHPALAEEHAD